MSYNIFSKNASFKGDISGTIENQVNDWDTQTVNGAKTFTNLTASNGLVFSDGLISGSGTISASFFFGDGAGLTNAGTITAFNNSGENRILAGDSTSTTIKGLSDVTFSGGKLGVTGQLSASLGVSGTTFHGAGGAITDLDADNITAGSLSAARLDLASAGGLENNSDSLQINLSGTASGLSLDSDGLQIDVDTLGTDSGFDTGKKVIVQDGANPPKQMTLSVIQAGLTIQGSQLGGTIANGRLPTAISQPFITGSTAVSGAFFFGDGSGLTNVTSTPSPAGANTQLQFNDEGSLAADAQLTFLTGSNTLATTIVSASAHVSASEFAGINGTLIDSDGNFAGNNASFAEITGSSFISSSAGFQGDAKGLNNVPLVSSNAAAVVFVAQANDQSITTNSAFTFNGTDAVNSGGGFNASSLSASGDVTVYGNVVVNEVTLSDSELGVLDGVTAGTAAADKAMVLNSDKAITGFKSLISETDNSSRISITGSAGRLLSTIEGITFKNIANETTAKVLQSGVISGSSDLEVGGHITGSGDIKLLDGSIYLANGGSLFFDGDDGGAAIDVSISELGTNKLLLDGNNQVVIRQDEYFVIQDHSSAARLTADLRSTAAINKITTDLAISSSNFISASVLHTMTGITAPGPGGDINVLDSNGNLNVGSITMADGAGSLNFGDNEISGSGNISGSAFFGDGSNLQNVQATPQFRYQYINSVVKMNTNLVTANSFQLFPADADGLAQSSDRTTHFVMPGSGSIERVIMTPSFYNTNGSSANVFTTAHTPQFFVRKNDITEGTPISGIALQMTASAANMKPLNLPNNAGTLNTQIVIFDLDNNSPAITGSNSFDPGDILIFSGRNDAVVSDVAITIVLKIEEAGVTYP